MNAIRHAWRLMGVPGRVAAGIAIFIMIFLGYQMRHVADAAMAPSARASAEAGEGKQRGMQYAAAVDTRVRHIDGRSLFFVPSAPPPPPPPPPPKVEEKDPPPPPPPASYGGPKIIAMLNGAVWFDDGERLKAGESNDKVKLVRLDAPWGARVEWRGVEFDVGLFERDKIVMPRPVEQKKEEASAPDAEAEPARTVLSAESPTAPEAKKE